MANKKNKRRNKNKKNVAGGAPPAANPISNSPPPSSAPTEETIIPNIAAIEKLAIDLATAAFEKHHFDIDDVAKEMKNEFDNRFGPIWHCIIGRDFGFFISCEENCYFRFQLNLKNVLLFKCG
ncbi:hypothetical protein P8452_52693 [Trifolium repens]|nr:hypothetical protein P8452_52693 [Trifolium repens]